MVLEIYLNEIFIINTISIFFFRFIFFLPVQVILYENIKGQFFVQNTVFPTR